jgi:hypothetical protein
LPTFAVRRAQWFLPLLAAALFVAVLAGPAAAQAVGITTSTGPFAVAQETTTSSTAATSQTTAPSTATSATSAQGEGTGQTAIIPPSAAQTPLNPGWRTDQMDIRFMPEYDQKAVLVIVGFALPADVPLPATIKFAVPAGAQIAGIGEVDPNGTFTYNYTTAYPPVEPGAEWDIATIEVKNYRQLQIDYYYDPGLPQGAGQRSFPILAQMPMDVGTLLLHVQEPARATDFVVQPALQGSGQAEDGFTYWVATYDEVKAGSTLGHQVSYYKPDGGLSTDSEQSTAVQSNTNTVLLAAILVVVVVVGVFVVYRLYSNSRSPNRQNGRPGGARRSPAAPPVGTKRQRQADKAPQAPLPKGAATTKSATPKAASAKGAATIDGSGTADTTAEPGDEVVEYCVACGEELDPKSRFCPNCGEAR